MLSQNMNGCGTAAPVPPGSPSAKLDRLAGDFQNDYRQIANLNAIQIIGIIGERKAHNLRDPPRSVNRRPLAPLDPIVAVAVAIAGEFAERGLAERGLAMRGGD